MILGTVLLNKTTWDLMIDGLGNIASDNTSYAVAQDVASAVRTVRGEVFYDETLGIPYPTLVWGQNYVPQLVKALIEDAAKTVPGVVLAEATLSLSHQRILSGDIKVIDENGVLLNANF
jgi:hypothetical protein